MANLVPILQLRKLTLGNVKRSAQAHKGIT